MERNCETTSILLYVSAPNSIINPLELIVGFLEILYNNYNYKFLLPIKCSRIKVDFIRNLCLLWETNLMAKCLVGIKLLVSQSSQ